VYDGIRAAIELIATSGLQPYRKSILVITDGQDKNSESTLQGLIDTINTKFSQYDVNLIVVAISREDNDFSDLERIVRAANGLFREAPMSRLTTVFQEIQRNL
jgi:Mg-chelatase subunit ChlD